MRPLGSDVPKCSEIYAPLTVEILVRKVFERLQSAQVERRQLSCPAQT